MATHDLNAVEQILAEVVRAQGTDVANKHGADKHAAETDASARSALIPILQAVQKRFGWLPPEVLRHVCDRTGITPAEVGGVASFYGQFRHRPVGEHIVSVCHGTACHVKGAGQVQEAFERYLHIPAGDDTDADGRFTVEKVACLGCCTLAPVVQIDGVTYGRLTTHQIPEVVDDFLHRGRREGEKPKQVVAADGRPLGEIRVGLGSCCQAQGSDQVYAAVEQALAESGAPAVVKRVGCVGMCHQTPLVEVIATPAAKQPAAPSTRPSEQDATGPGPNGAEVANSRLFAHVSADDVADIVLDQFQPRSFAQRARRRFGRWLDRLHNDERGDPARDRALAPRDTHVCAFLGPQRHVATEFCGRLDPGDLDEYLAHGGFEALRRAQELPPAEIIDQIALGGLRGRGGAGFPTGRKWAAVAAEPGPRYIVCNGDEGDPGAFMDRMLLESFPYRILEGMAIAARAVGADEGFLYIRAEYPLAVERIGEALEQCRGRGILGELELSIVEGAGAFVCGEETALIASIEGRRGMPRFRPPFPARRGLWGRPTLINNVETYACVPWIIRHGAEAFAALSPSASSGTKVFALAGKVRRGGLIEVPMGATIRQVVDEIGGGVAGGRALKAVQIGGPSGGCVPHWLADVPIDFDALGEVGAMMGSGGLVVLDETDCMVDIARYFLQFTQEQSCGKCTFCRVGTRRMLDILERLTRGQGRPEDLGRMEEIAAATQRASLCGLGRTAPNPILSTLRHFRDEYEAHIDGHCPAGRCQALIRYRITDDCIGCTLCAQHCPVDAIAPTPYEQHGIDDEKCTRCDACRAVCPADAVRVEKKK